MEAALGSHKYGQLSYHVIIITKYRKPVLKGLESEVMLVLNHIALENSMRMLCIEVAKDHVHMFISVCRIEDTSKIFPYLKGKSAYLLFKSHPELRKELRKGHLWSRGGFIRSVGSVTEESIRRYIEDSKEHDL